MPRNLKKRISAQRGTIAVILFVLLLPIAARVVPRWTTNTTVHRVADTILWVFRRS